MKFNSKLFLIGSCLLSVVAVTSCNEEFDITKEINTEITVGKNLQIPIGSTVQIPLSRIITESEDISAGPNGTYQLHIDGGFDSHITDIAPFAVNGLNPQFSDFVIDNLPKVNLPYIQEIPITIQTKATYEMAETRTELPSEVDALFYAEFNNSNGAVSHITISIPNIDNGTNGINEVNLHNVHIKFPDMFTLQDGSHELFREDIFLNASNNFTEDIQILIHDIQISAEEQSKYITVENGKKYFSFHEKISFDAETTVKVTPNQIKDTKMHFTFGYSIEPASITRVNGIVSPQVEINEVLSLNDIPEFIKDKESSFTPNDLAFEFALTNPVGMSLETTISITPWDNSTNSALGEAVTIALDGENAIKPETTTRYVIANTHREVAEGVTLIVNETLPTLLATIPDAYHISTNRIVADGTNCSGLELGKSYNLAGNYNVNVPFSFSNIAISYTDEVSNLHKDIDDFAELTNNLILEFDAVSTIPVDLEASVEFCDANGNTLNGISLFGQENNYVYVKGSENGEEATTHITLSLEEKSGSNDLELLDVIRYSIKAKNATDKDIVLKSSQYIMIKNGVAKLPKGITYKD